MLCQSQFALVVSLTIGFPHRKKSFVSEAFLENNRMYLDVGVENPVNVSLD